MRLAGEGVSEREVELLKRLHRLEGGIVEELSGQVEGDGAAEDGHHTPIIPRNSDSNGEKSYAVSPKMDEGTKGLISEAMESQTGKQFGRLVVDEGKRRYVFNAFWTILRKEVDHIQGILSEALFEGSESLVPESTLAAAVENQDHRSFILGYSSLQVSLRPPIASSPFSDILLLANVH